MSGLTDSKLRKCSHCEAKFVSKVWERRSFSIRFTCCSSTSGFLKLPLNRIIEKLIVRNAAPKKKR